MKPLHLEVHGSEIVFNNLYDMPCADWLDEDLAFIRLLDGTKLEVGWYVGPGGEGYFKIVHFQTCWNEPLDVIRTRDVAVVGSIIEGFAFQASRPHPRSPVPEYHPIEYKPDFQRVA
jgi:hypothetical protein